MTITIADWISQSSLTKLLATLVLLVLAVLIGGLLRHNVLRKLIRRWDLRTHLRSETVLVLPRVVAAVLWVVAGLLILGVWGVDVSGIWALLVSAAAVIGVGFLAVWTIISNVTASVFITIWAPFKLGQTVELLPENLKGRIVDRNMMFTVLRNGHDRVLHVPNNLFFQKMFWVTDDKAQSLFEFLEGDTEDQAQAVDLPEPRAPQETRK